MQSVGGSPSGCLTVYCIFRVPVSHPEAICDTRNSDTPVRVVYSCESQTWSPYIHKFRKTRRPSIFLSRYQPGTNFLLKLFKRSVRHSRDSGGKPLDSITAP